ncbi:hypothetical protein MN116_006358 [Schistosoma mekongi]|uniref:Uncharacterized protein n=1 Tax=Schistosoma mekongi TaxID=38744 RepID=A0AAE1ZCQ8_SCHME|nr:hypothetical protein MN116_006358 [Schistosoma mekongi]
MKTFCIEHHQIISVNLVILCFLIYKMTESILQYGNRISIYTNVCKALTYPIMNPSLLCQHDNRYYDYSYYKQHNVMSTIITSSNISNINYTLQLLDNQNNTLIMYNSYQINIQHLSGWYLLLYRFLLNIPAILTCLFYGSLLSRISQYYIMLIPCIGSIIACILFILSLILKLKLLPDSIILTLIGATLYGICGKSNAVSLSVNSYIIENSTINKRTHMLGRMLGVNFFGLAIGSLLLGVFYHFLSYFEILLFVIISNLFIITMLIFLMYNSKQFISLNASLPLTTVTTTPTTTTTAATTTTTIVVDNQLEINKTDQYPTTCKLYTHIIIDHLIKSFIQLKLSYKFLFQYKTTNKKHIYLLILLSTILLKQILKSGEQDITYLYLSSQTTLLWSSELYAYYITCYYSFMFIILIILLPIIERYFFIHDTTLIIFGLITEILRLLIIALINNTKWIFISSIIGSPAALITTCSRSLISKLVSNNEINTSFAFLSILEILANLCGGVFFTLIYNQSLLFYASFIFLLDIGFNIIIICIFIWLRRKLLHYEVNINNNLKCINSISISNNNNNNNNNNG